MARVFFFLIAAVAFIKVNAQTASKLDISAGYISIFFKKGTAKTVGWESTRRMPKGNFSCKEQEDGTLFLKYFPSDVITEYKVATRDIIGDPNKVPKQIAGFKLKGIYLNPVEPPEYYYALYIHPEYKNSLLIVGYLELGKFFTGANYYSETAENPFREKNIDFGSK
ncbi:hypothetical protein [Filimonas effusa]|uniref:Uncharacterized protein n=1 Tax=Filimonas effusa TaxID=2508721 RepID=A0A4V1MA16_9BACT|nr:hypothetical protein [Filimonas effusa]RXK83604.1 hypothetical protein ESB13_16080 [Filimonas effusa]